MVTTCCGERKRTLTDIIGDAEAYRPNNKTKAANMERDLCFPETIPVTDPIIAAQVRWIEPLGIYRFHVWLDGYRHPKLSADIYRSDFELAPELFDEFSRKDVAEFIETTFIGNGEFDDS